MDEISKRLLKIEADQNKLNRQIVELEKLTKTLVEAINELENIYNLDKMCETDSTDWRSRQWEMGKIDEQGNWKRGKWK